MEVETILIERRLLCVLKTILLKQNLTNGSGTSLWK